MVTGRRRDADRQGPRGSIVLARALLCPLALALAPWTTAWAAAPDAVPRLAVISAVQPEWEKLQETPEDRAGHSVNGTLFVTGRPEGQEVVLFLSGISMVTAGMATQLARERFVIEGTLVSGIAGGVVPDLSSSDVVVAGQWGR